MKIGLFEHGGVTRTILSIELGRAASRDTKVTCAEDVIKLVTEWLRANDVPWTRDDVLASPAPKPEVIIADDQVVATTKCPTCGSEPGNCCMTIRAQGSMGFQFRTPIHQRRLKMFAGRDEQSCGMASR